MSEEIKKDPFEITVKISFGNVEIEDQEQLGFNIGQILEKQIISDCVSSLRNIAKAHIDKVLAEQFNETVPKLVESMAFARLEVLQQTEKLKFSQYASDKEISIDEFIIQKLTQQRLGDMLEKFVDTRAKELGQTLKSHYDIAFANQLVKKLNEQGLLLPDVGRRLLDGQ